MSSLTPKKSTDKSKPRAAGSLRLLFQSGTRQIRRLLIFVVGITVLIIGIIMLVTPGPAVVVIPIGLGILGLEFAWARVLLQRFKEGAKNVGGGVKSWFRRGKKSAITLSALTIYPCKSLQGISLDRVLLEARGLKDDRRWMLVDSDGIFITQRQQPKMAQLAVSLSEQGLQISRNEGDSVFAPRGGAESRRVKVWSDWVAAESCGAAVDEWFSAVLGLPCCLVYMPERVLRPVDSHYAQPQDQVSFADGFPLLLLSEASLAALNKKLDKPVSMDHFRPNLVVSGCEAFAEDQWRTLKIGEAELNVVKPCSRCVITTIDPESGVKDPQQQPLRTLLTFRKKGKEVYFGQNVIARKHGELQLDQQVSVLEVAQERSVFK